MAAIAFYKFEHRLLGTIGLALLASYKNHGNYWRAESHLLLADKTIPCTSESLKFEHSPPEDGSVQVTDDVMLQAALDSAKAKFMGYVANLPELRQKLWSEATVSLGSSQDLLQVWIRQAFPNLQQCSHQTQSDELRQYIQSITKFSPIKASGL
jgi:hypothetical protein